jgi:hypothetical protein
VLGTSESAKPGPSCLCLSYLCLDINLLTLCFLCPATHRSGPIAGLAGGAAEGGARAIKRRGSNASSSNWAADAATAAAEGHPYQQQLPLPGEGDLEGLLGEDGVMYPSA